MWAIAYELGNGFGIGSGNVHVRRFSWRDDAARFMRRLREQGIRAWVERSPY